MGNTLANQILENLGGSSNVREIENCMTRLRVVVSDAGKVNQTALSAIKGVLKVLGKDNELQVVVGPGVADRICEELKTLGVASTGGAAGNDPAPIAGAMMQKKKARGIFAFFSQVFAPLIPVFAGTGLLYGVYNIFNLWFQLDPSMQIFNGAAIANGGSKFMTVLLVLAESFFAFLNVAVACQAAKIMGGNMYLGLAAGGIVANVGGLNGVAMGFLDLSFKDGRGGTLSALAAGALIAVVEQWIRKRTPDILKIHVPALFSVVVVGLLTLFIVQPVGGFITDVITTGLLWMFANAGALGGFIISALFLPLVMTGMHHGLTPVHLSLIQTVGYSTLDTYNSMAGAGQVGAAIALFYKYREHMKLRAAVAGGLPAGLLGIGEPLIFGVTLPLGRVFACACLGAGVGGLVTGFFSEMGAKALHVSGVLATMTNTKPGAYAISYIAAVAAGFALTWFIGVKKENLNTFGAD